MVAAATGFDQIALAQKEAEDLAKAVAEVQKYYPVVIDPKTMAWINLGMVASTIYGTRVVAIVMDKTGTPKTAENNVHVLRT